MTLYRYIRFQKQSPILGRLLQGGALEVQTVHTGFTIAAERPIVVNETYVAVGDAAFPYDPLAGAGVQFMLWSTTSVKDLLLETTSASDFDNFNHKLREHARAYHRGRHEIYAKARPWGSPGEYWQRQAEFSQAAAAEGLVVD